jgi:hypothetical protein
VFEFGTLSAMDGALQVCMTPKPLAELPEKIKVWLKMLYF